MAKQNETAVVKAAEVQPGGELAILNTGINSEFLQIMKENVGNGQVTPFDLGRIKVPAAAGLSFQLEFTEEKIIEGVIIAFSDTRAFWEKSIEEGGSGRPPDCHSTDGFVGIGSPGGDCVKCPFAQFGSVVKGGKQGAGQACKAMRNLLILRGESLLPDLLVVPPTSLKPIKKYFLSLATLPLPYFGAITRLELEKDKNADGIPYSKIKPSLVAKVPADKIPKLRELSQTMRGILGSITLTVDDYRVVTDQQQEQ